MKTKKTVKSLKPIRASQEVVTTAKILPAKTLPFSYKLLLVILFGVLCYLLATKYRNLILVGTVNNTPITRIELNSAMVDRYGKQVLEELVNEKLLASEISKQGVVVTDEDVNAEVAKITTEYGSEENFKTALEQYGLTLEKAKESIKKNLGFKKLVEKTANIIISDEAVTKYYEENKAIYTGKKIEEVKDSIKDSLYQQELYQKSQDIFTQLRQTAKVNSFL